MNQIQNNFLEESTSIEMLKFVQLISDAEDRGLLIEIVHTALKDMKSNPKSSPLLSLQIASDDWDL
jgi:hypothetical protein